MVVNNSKMADGRHFENRYIAISQRKIMIHELHVHEIVHIATDFELDERHVIKQEAQLVLG